MSSLLTYQMQHIEGREAAVDSPHETLQEDHLRQADTQTSQVAREGVEVVKIMELHGVGEVQGHVPGEDQYASDICVYVSLYVS